VLLNQENISEIQSAGGVIIFLGTQNVHHLSPEHFMTEASVLAVPNIFVCQGQLGSQLKIQSSAIAPALLFN
jgi:hypothetical protein